MSTFLWESIAFGPIHSRRLGHSLGINLLPTDVKICSFNCLYCECGWTLEKRLTARAFYPVEIVLQAIERIHNNLSILFFWGKPLFAVQRAVSSRPLSEKDALGYVFID